MINVDIRQNDHELIMDFLKTKRYGFIMLSLIGSSTKVQVQLCATTRRLYRISYVFIQFNDFTTDTKMEVNAPVLITSYSTLYRHI